MTTTYDDQWYNNHENLYTLAQWLRENSGWNWVKDNLLDVIEKPWKWDKEWRLASGQVDFGEYRPEDNPDNPHPIDAAHCDWCDAAVGYHTFDDGDGDKVIWIMVFEDSMSGLIACRDCRDSAAETVTS